jgi:hypothetical protein
LIDIWIICPKNTNEKKKDEIRFVAQKHEWKEKGWNSFIKKKILDKKHEWGKKGGGGGLKFILEWEKIG